MRTLYQRECGTCGKVIWRDTAHLRPVNFCSFACRNIYSHKGKPVKEEVKERISATLTGRKNPEHAEFMRGRTGENASKWKADSNNGHTGHHRAQRYFKLQPCEVCGALPGGKPRIERHHKDENPLNNDPSNIAFLCSKHHKEAHRKLKEAKVCQF